MYDRLGIFGIRYSAINSQSKHGFEVGHDGREPVKSFNRVGGLTTSRRGSCFRLDKCFENLLAPNRGTA